MKVMIYYFVTKIHKVVTTLNIVMFLLVTYNLFFVTLLFLGEFPFCNHINILHEITRGVSKMEWDNDSKCHANNPCRHNGLSTMCTLVAHLLQNGKRYLLG
jgi:hypothetical protein